MKSSKGWMAVVGISLALLVASYSGSAAAQGAAIRRPVADWVDAQGSRSAAEWQALLEPFIGPFIANYIVWSGRTGPHEDPTLVMVVDYAGLDAPAEIRGTVIERPVSGGTEVHVTLHTTDALAYVLDYTGLVFGDTLFGATPAEVAADVEPAFGDSVLELVYIVNRAPGEPMEDLVAVVFCGLLDPAVYCPGGEVPELLFVSFHATASGELREAFGVPEGTPGRASLQQTGPLGAAAHNGFQGALADGFPAEWIHLQVTGH